MKSHIIIRTEGGSSIGMGHIMRCLALSEMLKNNFKISFAIQQPDEQLLKAIHSVTSNIINLPKTDDFHNDVLNFIKYLDPIDIVVLDGYSFKTPYQKTIKEKGCKLVCIDDLHSWHHVADAVINHAEGVDSTLYSASPFTKIYLGFNYILLRKPFLCPDLPSRKITAVKSVFVNMGAAYVNNLTQKFTEAILEVKEIEEVHLMLNSVNPFLNSINKLIAANKKKIVGHFNLSSQALCSLLQKCDLAICPASNIALEASAAGIGLISGYTAENQLDILQGLLKNGAAINWGDLNAVIAEEIICKLKTLIDRTDVFNEQMANQKQLIDRKSAGRILNIFNSLSQQ